MFRRAQKSDLDASMVRNNKSSNNTVRKKFQSVHRTVLAFGAKKLHQLPQKE